MLTFLQLVKQHISHGNVNKNDIKAVYIAPMKALAQEVVSKFSERLAPLGMVVKEFTGMLNNSLPVDVNIYKRNRPHIATVHTYIRCIIVMAMIEMMTAASVFLSISYHNY
jgi:hypothetical protein